MASKQSAPRDNRLSMDDGDAIAHPADWTRPRLAA
jgi:hypothetical protein